MAARIGSAFGVLGSAFNVLFEGGALATGLINVAMSVAALVGAWAVWTWRRWGLYLLGTCYTVAAYLGIGHGQGPGAVLVPLATAAVLIVLAASRWQYFTPASRKGPNGQRGE
jgi:hypothetical protein